MIGLRVDKNTIMELKDMIIPAVIMVFGTIFVNLAVGILIARLSNLDLATALFASAPGGMTEMTLAANALGADTPKVALLHLSRLINVVALLPVVLRYFLHTVARSAGG